MNWNFFRIRAYKKGTCHFEFIDEKVWAKFNQHVSRIKGFPLPDSIKIKKARPEKSTA